MALAMLMASMASMPAVCEASEHQASAAAHHEASATASLRDTDLERCRALRAGLDERIGASGLGDPRHHRRLDVPWLRTDRFLAQELRRALADRETRAVDVILGFMSELDAAALERETERLSTDEPVASAAPVTSAVKVDDELAACRRQALDALRAQPPALLRETAAAAVPDQYSILRRILGGYFFAQPFLRAGARGWARSERAAIEALEPLESVPHRLFVPEARSNAGPTDIAWLLRAMRDRHPLAWPQPSPQERDLLAARFAPALAVDSDARADRIGRLEGLRGGPVVRTARPVAAVDTHLVRWGEHVLLQLSYTFWFPERPRTGPLDPYGGAVDGIVWRVTLGDDGRPLLWDSIHPCGCYHTLFLPADRALRIATVDPAREERPLVLPGPPADAAVRVRYSPSTHHVRELAAVQMAGHGSGLAAGASKEEEGAAQSSGATRRVGYRLEPYTRLLEAAPDRPPFGPDGLLAGTERLERLFLWPSGIDSPGAMRSAGRQPIAFLGRRHFESAELIDGLLRPVPSPER